MDLRAAGNTYCQPHSRFAFRILAIEGEREIHAAVAFRQVAVVKVAHSAQMCSQRIEQRPRQQRDTILLSLAVADRKFAPVEVDVLDAEAQAFHQPESAAVAEAGQ
jgi:ribose 1,5-bisphosphokinase PhnN